MNLTEFQQAEESREPHFLLLGNPVSHSLSPVMHNLASKFYGFETRYFAIQLEVSELNALAAYFNKDTFRGANITIPYKQTLLDFMDALDPLSQSIGAINTIAKRDFSVTGYNTDVHGFSVPLLDVKHELAGGRTIIFGTGGATKAIIHALIELDVEEIILISRRPQQRREFDHLQQVSIEGYDSWAALAEEAALLVNATPLGMDPNRDAAPIREGEKHLLKDKICYDIVYKPLKTKFLSMAEFAGARTIGGLEMLIHQGSKSFELWTGKPFPVEAVRKKLHEIIGN